jgi:putative oxidoreductase
MKLGLWALRTVVGGLFAGHGMQKLAGKFGGHGPDGTGQFFESLGLRPGKTYAIAAGAAEAGGGALIAAGAFTPLASALLSASMITAIRTVHAPKGPWAAEGGYEYNLVLLAAVFAITDAGPGRLSIDAARGRERWRLPWALAQLAAGAAGSVAAIAYGASQPAAEPAAAADEQVPLRKEDRLALRRRPWRGGRAVECGGLENRCASYWRTESSNLSPSVV